MNAVTMKVAIIGFGKLGRALAAVLESKKEECTTCAWDVVETSDPRQVKTCSDAVRDASVVLLAVPSAHFSESLARLDCLSKRAVLVSCTKGFDSKTGLLPYHCLKKSFPKNPAAVLSGPMLSEELEAGLPTRATLAADNPKKVQTVAELFAHTSLAIELSPDPVGASLFGILKNIYALGTGLADGLELGSNFRACIALQAVKEMRMIVQNLGGKADTFFTCAGLADFLTTAYSPKSRNYQYGRATGRNEEPGSELAEGVLALPTVFVQYKKATAVPLLAHLNLIFKKGKDPNLIARTSEF